MLQADLSAARAELETALADAGSNRSALDELLQAKEALEGQLAANKSLMDGLQSSLDAANQDLEEIKAKVRRLLALLVARFTS